MEAPGDSATERAAPFARRRRRKILAWAVILLAVYVGSHLALSRYSAWRLREAFGEDQDCPECFLYVPCRLEMLRDHRSLFRVHWVMVIVYAPAWAVDYYLLGGPNPMMSEPMWGLSPAAAGDP